MLGETTVGVCDIEPAARAHAAKRLPGVPCFADVTTLTGDEVIANCGPIDCLEGGSPCQDVSVAGGNAGFAEGEKSSLIWHQLRLVRELRPRVMRWENVPGAITPKHRPQFDAFLNELAALGYGGAWCVMSAAQAGAPHLRKRVWLHAELGRVGWRDMGTKHLPQWPHPAAMWQTPVADDAVDRVLGKWNSRGEPKLSAEVLQDLWPTARVSGRGSFEFVRDDGKVRDDLETTAFMGEMWPTTTVQDGENAAGVSQFTRNTLPLNAEIFRDLVRNLPPEQIKAVIGDRRLNPDWVENLMGWPLGWSDLDCDKPRIPVGTAGEYLFPSGRFAPQRPHEPPRITSVKPRSSDAKARNARLKMCGNGWCPQSAAMAFSFLTNPNQQ